MVTARLRGLSAWALQRLTALYMALYLLAFVIAVPSEWSADSWQAFVTTPWVSIATALFLAAALWHAWIGVRDIILDYARTPMLRFILLVLTAGWLVALALWTLRIFIGLTLA